MIKEIKGDLLSSNCKIRCHQVNCRGVMGAGIAKQIKVKYPTVYPPYRQMCQDLGSNALGKIQVILCSDGTMIANLFAQNGYGTGKIQTDMTAMEQCIKAIRQYQMDTGASVGFPKFMGAGLARGNWNDIYAVIQKYFGGDNADCLIVEYAK